MCRLPERTTSQGETDPPDFSSVQPLGSVATGLNVSQRASGRRVAGFWNQEKFSSITGSDFGQNHLQIHCARERSSTAAHSLRIFDLKMREQAMSLFAFFYLKTDNGRDPLLALCSEAFNVGLAEILLGPVLFADHVGIEKAGIILLRERLIRKEGERMSTGGPFASGLLVAQPENRAILRVERNDEMLSLNVAARGARGGMRQFGDCRGQRGHGRLCLLL